MSLYFSVFFVIGKKEYCRTITKVTNLDASLTSNYGATKWSHINFLLEFQPPNPIKTPPPDIEFPERVVPPTDRLAVVPTKLSPIGRKSS